MFSSTDRDQFGIAGAPFGDPGGSVAMGLFDRTPVVELAQLLQAIVVGLSRQMIERVAEKMPIVSLERGLAPRLAEAALRPA